MDFIQLLFGTDKREIWQDFSSLANGEFIDGGFWGSDRLKLHYKNWTITFDTLTKKYGKSSKIHTRSQVIYEKKQDFVFFIYPEKYFGFLERIVDVPTIITHFEDIDDNYIIKGNQESILKEFISDDLIRNLLQTIPFFSFRTIEFEPFSDHLYKKEYKVLSVETSEEKESVDHLQSLLRLNQATLNKLSAMDVICPDKPDIDLF